MPPDVDVIIVTYNSAHVVGDLLDGLPAALDGLAADVLVVDNGSTDGTPELVAARSDCRLARSTNRGYAAGINSGVRAALPAKALLVLNPDVRMAAGSISPLLGALAAPNVGIAVPRVDSPNGGLEMSLRREPTLLRALGLAGTGLQRFSEYVSDRAEYRQLHIVDWALGAVFVISRECYDALGGLDESYFLYSEETDMSLRARDLGWLTMYVPEARTVHIGGQSGRNNKTHAMQIVNRVRLYRRRHGLVSAWCYFWLAVASELSWLIRGHQQSRAALGSLLLRSRRPVELGCSSRIMPS